MPNDFVLRCLDSGIANSTNLFPNNEAWAIFTGSSNVSPIGTQCAISQSWFSSGSVAANRWMITPAIELGTNVYLQWDARAYESAYPDGYEIKLSTTNNNTESFTATLFSTVSEVGDWTNHVIDLSEYLDETVYIAFIQNSNDMNIIMIDNIKIIGTAGVHIGIDNVVSENNVSIYPNPSNGLVHVLVSENSVVKVIDLTGKILETHNAVAGSEVNFTQSAGMYFIQVENSNGTSVHKVVIE